MDRSGREYGRVYERVRRQPVHEFLEDAVRASGGSVLFSSGNRTAPLFLAVEDAHGARYGIVAYAFLMNEERTLNRPTNENRGQIRYGDVNDPAWRAEAHPLSFDPAGIDVTCVVGCHIERGLIIGLDPGRNDPLPIGNSFYAKAGDLDVASERGWNVWEGRRRASDKRVDDDDAPDFDAIVALQPSRFLDFVAYERHAQTMGLDSALRLHLAVRSGELEQASQIHDLEAAYGLTASDVLDIIQTNARLGMAVRGGVAERHLQLQLESHPLVTDVRPGNVEGPPDFIATVAGSTGVRIECKNASPKTYAGNVPKVEVQKTRASKDDPTSRFYGTDAFDVVAACLFGPTSEWEFRFCRTDRLTPHPQHANKIAPLQRVDERWHSSIVDALTD